MTTNVQVFEPVPEKCVGYVIGKEGWHIKKLRRETETSIQKLKEGFGFMITGSPANCEAARLKIRELVGCAMVSLGEHVPQQFVGLVICRDGSNNFRQIENECNVKIRWPKFTGKEKDVVFNISGRRADCERASKMLRNNIEKWRKSNVVHKTGGSPNYSEAIVEIIVLNEYLGAIVGLRRENLDDIAIKSSTQIRIRSSPPNVEESENKEFILEITGTQTNCDRAKVLIKDRITSCKDRKNRDEYGGDKQFVCLEYVDEQEQYQFKPAPKIAPKQDGYLTGERYRIEANPDNHSEVRDVSDQAISDLREHLLTSLQKLHKLKDEKELMVDLWCHLGKVYVEKVDGESARETITPADLRARLRKITSSSKKADRDWKVFFEEGVDPPDDNDKDCKLSTLEDENNDSFNLKLVHTQWRYDYAFITPSDRNVRLKVWEGLPPGSDEPPVEVKNILRPVCPENAKNFKAWLCYPATTVLRGEIMTPNSKYDCKVKLRAGPRIVSDKDVVSENEDMILAEYLSKCKFDRNTHDIHLPDEEHKIPDGFECTFCRVAKERMFCATVIDVDENKACFTIVLDERLRWDSYLSTKRDQKKFGIRVVKNSWSEVLLSRERNWEPEEILATLKQYMMFLSALGDYLFNE